MEFLKPAQPPFLFRFFSHLVWISVAVTNSMALGEPSSALKFPPSLNQFKILNQKLEYHLIDDNSIRLGHILISSSGMKLELVRQLNKPILRFTGPEQFMTSSQIIIRDPSGKALWKKDVSGVKSKIETLPTDIEGAKHTIKIYDDLDDSEDILSLASESTFFNYCLFHENETHRFNICSVDYNVSYNKGNWELKTIKPNVPENRFTVNGVEVGSEGEIQFTKDLANISLTAKLLSGLLIEVKTREVPLSLIDYDYDKNKPYLKLKVRTNFANLSDANVREWDSKISLDRPFFYIEAEGQVSLKQELIIAEDLMTEKEKPRVKFDQAKTYSSSMELELVKAPTDTFNVLQKGDVISTSNRSVKWILKNLQSNQLNQRQLEVTRTGSKHPFIGTYEIVRGLPWEINLNLRISNTSDSQSTEKVTRNGTGLGIKYFFTNFLWLSPASWNYLRWGLLADYRTDHSSKNKETHSDTIESLELLYRLQPGIHHLDAALSLGMGFTAHQLEDSNLNGPSLSFRYSNPVAKWGPLGDKIFACLKYFPAINDDKMLLKGLGYEASFEARYKLSNTLDWSWTLSQRSENLEIKALNTKREISNQGINLGVQKRF